MNYFFMYFAHFSITSYFFLTNVWDPLNILLIQMSSSRHYPSVNSVCGVLHYTESFNIDVKSIHFSTYGVVLDLV